MTDKTRKTAKARASSGVEPRNVLSLGVAAGIVVLFGAMAFVAMRDVSPGAEIVNDSVEQARPTGAGTVPDGRADELVEGLGNQTSESDFVSPGAPGDTDAELLVPPLPDTEQAPSVEGLDPIAPVDDEVLERMAPDGVELDDAETGGAETDSAETDGASGDDEM